MFVGLTNNAFGSAVAVVAAVAAAVAVVDVFAVAHHPPTHYNELGSALHDVFFLGLFP